jgi:hypothetical protein
VILKGHGFSRAAKPAKNLAKNLPGFSPCGIVCRNSAAKAGKTDAASGTAKAVPFQNNKLHVNAGCPIHSALFAEWVGKHRSQHRL